MSTKVRSGHNICCLCSFLLELSSCRVTYENCYKSSVFFNQVWDEWMDLRNSKDFELRNFYFATEQNFFSKIFIRRGKMHHVELNSGTSKSSKRSFYTFEDIELWEAHAKVHKTRAKLWELIQFLRLEISICCLHRNFNWFPLYFAHCSFAEMKTTFIKLQNESLPKDIGQELLTVNNSVLTFPIFFIALSQWREFIQVSISSIIIPPRTPGDLHQTFAPTLGLLHPRFCPGVDLLGQLPTGGHLSSETSLSFLKF